MPYPLNRVTPPITQLYGYPVTSKMRAAAIKQAQYATLEFPLYDPTTLTPIDLTDYGYSNGTGPQGPQADPDPVSWLKFRFLEASGSCNVAADAETQWVDNAAQGIVSCLVPAVVTANAGVYNCEVGMFNEDNNLVFSNTCYVYIDRGLFNSSSTLNPQTSGMLGPPTIAEIRLNLRDQPEINRLIDEYEFDVADICEAAVKSVMYFNMSQPPIMAQFSTTNFPWRYQWLDGICAHLYEIASGFYRRNHLKHQTAGLAVDDINREQEYLQAWKIRFERWSTWVKTKRVQLNMEEGFGALGSSYSRIGYRGGYYW